MFTVVLLPNFRLQAALRFREELHAQPVAIIEANDPKAGILEINDAAQKAGVTAGQTSRRRSHAAPHSRSSRARPRRSRQRNPRCWKSRARSRRKSRRRRTAFAP